MNGDQQQPAMPSQGSDSGNWQFKPEAQIRPSDSEAVTSQPPADIPPEPEIVWTASEFIDHHKSPVWYLSVAAVSVLFTALIYLITKDRITAVIIVIVTIAFVISATRKPRILEYAVDPHGVSVGRQFFAYGDFKSFSVIDEGKVPSIFFMPMKRFMPSLTVYYDPSDEERIVSIINAHLPFEKREPAMIDRIMHYIRF